MGDVSGDAALTSDEDKKTSEALCVSDPKAPKLVGRHQNLNLRPGLDTSLSSVSSWTPGTLKMDTAGKGEVGVRKQQ